MVFLHIALIIFLVLVTGWFGYLMLSGKVG